MEFFSDVNELHGMLAWIVKQLQPMKFSKTLLQKIELASEEAIVNIIHHAYQERRAPIEIEVYCTTNHAQVIFKDWGPSFNPLKDHSADCASGLEQRKVGGLGIHLMRECIPDISYKRLENQNILTFTIHSSQKK